MVVVYTILPSLPSKEGHVINRPNNQLVFDVTVLSFLSSMIVSFFSASLESRLFSEEWVFLWFLSILLLYPLNLVASGMNYLLGKHCSRSSIQFTIFNLLGALLSGALAYTLELGFDYFIILFAAFPLFSIVTGIFLWLRSRNAALL